MYEFLLTSTDNMISVYVFGTWNTFNAIANPWISIMMALYVVIMGYLAWLGRINISFADLMPRIFKLAAIYVLVTNIGLLTMLVYATFIDIPASIVGALYDSMGENTGSINANMTQIYDHGIEAAQNISKKAGYNVILHIYALLITLLTVSVVMVAGGYIVLGKLAVAVLLALAPFFILLYLFNGTKALFEGWLRQILTFALIPVLVYALLLLIVGLLSQISEELMLTTQNSGPRLKNIASFTVICGVSILLLTQVKSWAAGIGGGFQLSSLGMFKNSVSGAVTAGRHARQMRQRWKSKDRSSL
tara:strand:+ start:5502 stop:6413 length:912 start_codon:yes stop_codon:yes gene_type:complete